MRWDEWLRAAAKGLSQKRSLPIWVLSFLFASSVAAGRRIVFSGNVGSNLNRTHIAPWSSFDALTIVVGVPLCALLVALLAEVIENGDFGSSFRFFEPRDGRRFVLAVLGVAGSLLLAWSPYILTYAPGSIVGDTLSALAQPHQVKWSNHTPIAFTLLIKLFARVGIAFGNINYGIFAFTVFQSLLMATVLGYGVVWLARKGVPRYWCAATWAYFAFVPAFPIYAINMQKDTLFSLSVVAFALFLFDAIEGKGASFETRRGIATFLVLGVLMIFLRNNGIYIVAGTTLALAWVYRSRLKALYISVAVLLVVASFIQGPVYNHLKIRNGAFVESAGVPLQQIAYVISTHGNVTPAQEEFLYRVLPRHDWIQMYAPSLVDELKWDKRFDQRYFMDHKLRFLVIWAEILIHNPSSYFDAYCLDTFGFWKIGVSNAYGYGETYVHANNLNIRATDLVKQLTGTSIKPLLDATRGKDGSGGYVGVGIVVWLMLLVLALLLRQRRADLIVVAMPCFLVWLTIMIATPVAFGFRYVLVLALCLPGILLLPFVAKDSPAN